MIAAPGSPAPPAHVRAAHEEWIWSVAYQYGPAALTYRIAHPAGPVRYLKLAPEDAYPSLADESARMVWVANHLPVPTVVESGSRNGVAWLLTTALPGVDATDPGLRDDPGALVRVLATGLRRFHDVPIVSCPFDFRLSTALRHVARRLDEGRIDPARDFHPEHAHLDAAEAVALLHTSRPASQDLVVCHGDFCLPNVMVQDGRASGFLDLGELGVADRWWDLAVATWSVTWNLGPGHEALFLATYGVSPDEERIRFFRLLYDLAS